ncbi:DUF3261 domain-containing protein [Zhongshania borealis]|uniref:DUF3261 domain-containing protein n=1 Tax=Zhongshania borealis TaxID=889488 RepID=UPI0031E59919
MFLTSCATQQHSSIEALRLPPRSTLACCWQSQESIQITITQNSAIKKIALLSALEVTPTQLTVVIFDPLGRRLASFAQDDAGLHTHSAPPEWDTRLAQQMLLAIYLHHIPSSAWNFQGSDWSITTTQRSRALLFRQQIQLQIDYADDSSKQDRRISYPGQPLVLDIRTLSRTAL